VYSKKIAYNTKTRKRDSGGLTKPGPDYTPNKGKQTSPWVPHKLLKTAAGDPGEKKAYFGKNKLGGEVAIPPDE